MACGYRAGRIGGNMKKFAASLLSAVLLLSLTACGSTETKQQENTQAGVHTENSEHNAERTSDADVESSMESSAKPGQAADIEDGFILIAGGTFRMGSPDTENWRSDDETQHTVTVSDCKAGSGRTDGGRAFHSLFRRKQPAG